MGYGCIVWGKFCMGTILIIIMLSHGEIYNISGIYNKVDVFMGYTKLLLYSMGKQHGAGVHYIKASLPIYIGEIMHTPTQNLLYYRGMRIQLV